MVLLLVDEDSTDSLKWVDTVKMPLGNFCMRIGQCANMVNVNAWLMWITWMSKLHKRIGSLTTSYYLSCAGVIFEFNCGTGKLWKIFYISLALTYVKKSWGSNFFFHLLLSLVILKCRLNGQMLELHWWFHSIMQQFNWHSPSEHALNR